MAVHRHLLLMLLFVTACQPLGGQGGADGDVPIDAAQAGGGRDGQAPDGALEQDMAIEPDGALQQDMAVEPDMALDPRPARASPSTTWPAWAWPSLAAVAAVEGVDAFALDRLHAYARTQGWTARCGDGRVQPADEICDLADGDGCAADCTLETVCGNGIVETASWKAPRPATTATPTPTTAAIMPANTRCPRTPPDRAHHRPRARLRHQHRPRAARHRVSVPAARPPRRSRGPAHGGPGAPHPA